MTQTNEPTPPPTPCPDCRALVTDLAGHKQWHSRLVSDLAKAVEKEIKRSSPAPG